MVCWRFLRRIHGRRKEIALPSFILQAEPGAESRQTWGDSAPPSAFLCLNAVVDSAAVLLEMPRPHANETKPTEPN